MSEKDIVKEARRILEVKDFEYFYGVIEDKHGKYPSPYSEYFFIKVNPELSINKLEDTEVFKSILKVSASRYSVVTEDDILQIRAVIEVGPSFKVGDRVKVTQGDLRGNHGKILSFAEDFVVLRVFLGLGEMECCLDSRWVKKIPRRKKEA